MQELVQYARRQEALIVRIIIRTTNNNIIK